MMMMMMMTTMMMMIIIIIIIITTTTTITIIIIFEMFTSYLGTSLQSAWARGPNDTAGKTAVPKKGWGYREG